MTVLPFEPRRLWPDWRSPDPATRQHVLSALARAGTRTAIDREAWGMTVWYPGFLPRYLCVRCRVGESDPWRFQALIGRAPGGPVFARPSWRLLSRNRRVLGPWITRGSALSWLAFALATAAPAAEQARVLGSSEGLVIPGGVEAARARALTARAEAPSVIREGRDGIVLRASIAARSGLTTGAFHIRPDGEVFSGASSFLPWFSDDDRVRAIVLTPFRTS